MNPSARSPYAVRTSITDRLKKHAAAKGQQFNAVKRCFVMARFLSRVFNADPEGWILKGGIGMMVRLPQARYSRYRDLVDLLLVSMFLPIELRPAVEAVEAVERERAAREIAALPKSLVIPGPDWENGWPAEAKRSPLTADYGDLEAAIATARRCYDRILGAIPETDVAVWWNPRDGSWGI